MAVHDVDSTDSYEKINRERLDIKEFAYGE